MSGGNGRNQQRSNFRRVQGPLEGSNGSKPRKSHTNKKTNKNGGSSWNKDTKHIGDSGCDEEFNEQEFCIICADRLQYAALSPCSHRTCHRCSFRQRALFNKNKCLVCRSEIDRLIFTEKLESKYDDFQEEFAEFNEQYGIYFTSNQVATDTLDLLKFRCNICVSEKRENYDRDYGSFNKYKEHLRDEHNKTICMICAIFKKAFPCELKVYTPNQLRNHQSRGDVEGFKGHPMCGYCSGRRFYSDDELYLHMRDQHEKCHICDRIDPSQPQYFKNYDQLFEHFKTAHYICSVQSCLDDKFVVFRDEIELQAHILGEHGDIIRGKPKLFQSELSTFISAPSRVIREDGMSSIVGRDNRTSRDADSNSSPDIASRRLEERAKHYLNGAVDGLDTFNDLNRNFDRGKLSVESLVDGYNKLFKSPNADVYLLVRNLAETYPSQSAKFRTLNAVYERHEQELNRSALPTLSTGNVAPVINSVWSANNNNVSSSHGGRVNRLDLPTLQSPSPSHDVFAPRSGTASYKNLNSSKSSSRTPTPVVRTASSSSLNHNNANWKPTYLDKKPKPKSKPASSPSLRRPDKLAALDLPSLPTPKPAVYIPPVNRTPLPDPKKWGKNKAPQPPPSDPFDELLTSNLTGSSNKKKDKRKQLLFHIGI